MALDHAFPLSFVCHDNGPPTLPSRQVNRRLRVPHRRRSLSVLTPTATCLNQARRCGVVACRYHLGGTRVLPDGHAFRCSLDVANSYPHGLAPVFVAHLLGVSESDAQRAEHAAYGKMRLAMQRLGAEEREGARQARARAAKRRAEKAPPARPVARAVPTAAPGLARTVAPAPEAPALTLTPAPPRPLPPPAPPRPRPAPPVQVDPRQLVLPFVA